MLLFLSFLFATALVLAAAQRRAKAIRLRIESRLRDVPQGSWEAWHSQPRGLRHTPEEWWSQP
jgi:hypothetical protein